MLTLWFKILRDKMTPEQAEDCNGQKFVKRKNSANHEKFIKRKNVIIDKNACVKKLSVKKWVTIRLEKQTGATARLEKQTIMK
jgi:hypothetical protein